MKELSINKIAAIGDVHFKANDQGSWMGTFREISNEADVLLICGDLTDTGDEDEARLLVDELKACSVPVVCVLGNHDHEKGRQKLIRQILQEAGVHVLDGEALVLGNVGFAGVKGFGGGFDHFQLSMFGEDSMKAFVQQSVDESLHLERALSRLDAHHADLKKVVLLHYSPLSETVIGEPEQIYPFLGSSRLAESIAKKHVDAVFHGHAHAGQLEGHIGHTPVWNVARPVLQRLNMPYFLLDVNSSAESLAD